MSRHELKYFDDDAWEPYYYSVEERPLTHLTYQQRRIKNMMAGKNKVTVSYNHLDTNTMTCERITDGFGHIVSIVEGDMVSHKDWTIRLKETGELWHSVTKVVATINGEYLYNDDGTRKHDIVVNVHHRKKNKQLSIDSLMKVANCLNPGDHIKYLKKPLRGYVSQELYDRLIKYYKYEDPDTRAIRSSESEVLSMDALTKLLSNIIDQTRRRQAFSPGGKDKLSKTQQHEIAGLEELLPNGINETRKQLVVKDIMDLVIETDRKRNETIKKRIKREIRKADRTHKAQEDFSGCAASAYDSAFSKLVSLLQGGQVYDDHTVLKFISREDGLVNLDGLIEYAQSLDDKIHKDLNEKSRRLYGVNDKDSPVSQNIT